MAIRVRRIPARGCDDGRVARFPGKRHGSALDLELLSRNVELATLDVDLTLDREWLAEHQLQVPTELDLRRVALLDPNLIAQVQVDDHRTLVPGRIRLFQRLERKSHEASVALPCPDADAFGWIQILKVLATGIWHSQVQFRNVHGELLRAFGLTRAELDVDGAVSFTELGAVHRKCDLFFFPAEGHAGVGPRQVQPLESCFASDIEPTGSRARAELLEFCFAWLERQTSGNLVEALTDCGYLGDTIRQLDTSVEFRSTAAEMRVQVAVQSPIEIAEHRGEQRRKRGQAQLARLEPCVSRHAHLRREARAPIQARMRFGRRGAALAFDAQLGVGLAVASRGLGAYAAEFAFCQLQFLHVESDVDSCVLAEVFERDLARQGPFELLSARLRHEPNRESGEGQMRIGCERRRPFIGAIQPVVDDSLEIEVGLRYVGPGSLHVGGERASAAFVAALQRQIDFRSCVVGLLEVQNFAGQVDLGSGERAFVAQICGHNALQCGRTYLDRQVFQVSRRDAQLGAQRDLAPPTAKLVHRRRQRRRGPSLDAQRDEPALRVTQAHREFGFAALFVTQVQIEVDAFDCQRSGIASLGFGRDRGRGGALARELQPIGLNMHVEGRKGRARALPLESQIILDGPEGALDGQLDIGRNQLHQILEPHLSVDRRLARSSRRIEVLQVNAVQLLEVEIQVPQSLQVSLSRPAQTVAFEI